MDFTATENEMKCEKSRGGKEIKVLHVIDVDVILFPGLLQHHDSCLLMHTLLRPFSLQKQSHVMVITKQWVKMSQF